MCGFCGIYEPTGAAGIDPTLLRQMTGLMAERGPDAEGFWSDSRIGLGHRRLTIIDLAAGEQPVYNEDRSILVVFNGEIFNYQELRRDLIARGHRFSTNTDTEVIVHSYEEFGIACVERFRGMFAFALYDTKQGSLFMARDRLGIKPLYYSMVGNRLVFASEVKPVLLARGGLARPEPAAIDFFTAVGYVPGEDTMFQGVKKLLPGHLLQWKPGQAAPRIDRYWDVPDGPARNLTFDEASEEFQALLRESVRLRLISDVPLGAFLSGGVDSSVIVAQMRELMTSPVKTFSIGYGDSPEHNELPHARAVAEHLGTDHVEHVLTHGDFFENVEAFVIVPRNLSSRGAGIALYHLARRARRDVTVVLSGEGGDEALAGYPLYSIMRKMDSLRSVARPFGGAAIARLLRLEYRLGEGGEIPGLDRHSARRSLLEHSQRLHARHPCAHVHRWLQGGGGHDGFRLLRRPVCTPAGRLVAQAHVVRGSQELAARRSAHQGRQDDHGGVGGIARAIP